MPNALNLYDPLFYANEALIILAKQLGMAGRVHRGYDKNPQDKGSIIKISAPSSFAAQDAPSSAQDITPDAVSITLDQWKEVKFGLTDKELTLSRENLISDHIAPAAIALADTVDTALATLYQKVGYAINIAGSTMALADVASGRKVLFDNKAPLRDQMNLHLMIDGASEAAMLPIMAPNTMGGTASLDTLRNGSIGKVFGFDVFSNQNTPTHTDATIADAVGAVTTGGWAKGATTIGFTAVSAAAAFKKGDIFTIAGDAQGYTLTADNTADGSGVMTNVTFFPPLKIAVAGTPVATFNITSGATKTQNLMFHRNAFALATAPLSTMASDLGARIATVADPITGLSLRSRVYYEGANSKVFVALDILYGYECLDNRLAVRIRS